MGSQPVQYTHDIACTVSLPDVDSEGSPCKNINEGLGSKSLSVGQLVCNEVETPSVIDRRYSGGGEPTSFEQSSILSLMVYSAG